MKILKSQMQNRPGDFIDKSFSSQTFFFLIYIQFLLKKSYYQYDIFEEKLLSITLRKAHSSRCLSEVDLE